MSKEFTKWQEMLVRGLLLLGLSSQDCLSALVFMETFDQQQKMLNWILENEKLIEASPEARKEAFMKELMTILKETNSENATST